MNISLGITSYCFLRYEKENATLLQTRQTIEGFKKQEKEVSKRIQGLELTKTTVMSDLRFLKERLSDQSSAQAIQEKMTKEREKKLDELENRMTAITRETESAAEERDLLEREQETNKCDMDKNMNDRKAHQTKVAKLETEVEELQGLGKAKLAVFDRLAPKVVEEIREAVR